MEVLNYFKTNRKDWKIITGESEYSLNGKSYDIENIDELPHGFVFYVDFINKTLKLDIDFWYTGSKNCSGLIKISKSRKNRFVFETTLEEGKTYREYDLSDAPENEKEIINELLNNY